MTTVRPIHWVRRVIGSCLVITLLLVGVSVGRALTGPGNDSTAARLAEWGRDHKLSSVIDWLERKTYQAPRVGGTPAANSPLRSALPGSATTAATAPITPFGSPALPNEGSWHVLSTAGGRPLLQVAYLRPDAVHTSYTAAVAWMDTRRLRFVLHPGTIEPGHGPWSVPPSISSSERPHLLAAFNGGFRLDAAHGGFHESGRTRGTLRVGAASLVITPDGRASVGQWGRDFPVGGNFTAVRQNLDLLVDAGHPVPGLADNRDNKWGKTVGNRLYVWRSGVGVTASGALVYVAGNRLSAETLAALLTRAGCVRAMELDINPDWTSFVVYNALHAKERNLLPDMRRRASRYDSTSTRDFVTVSMAGS